jgi:hypothetical protein
MIARLFMILGLTFATQIDAQETVPEQCVEQEICVPAKKVVRRARPRRFRRYRRKRCCVYRDRDAEWPGKRDNTFMEVMSR